MVEALPGVGVEPEDLGYELAVVHSQRPNWVQDELRTLEDRLPDLAAAGKGGPWRTAAVEVDTAGSTAKVALEDTENTVAVEGGTAADSADNLVDEGLALQTEAPAVDTLAPVDTLG